MGKRFALIPEQPVCVRGHFFDVPYPALGCPHSWLLPEVWLLLATIVQQCEGCILSLNHFPEFVLVIACSFSHKISLDDTKYIVIWRYLEHPGASWSPDFNCLRNIDSRFCACLLPCTRYPEWSMGEPTYGGTQINPNHPLKGKTNRFEGTYAYLSWPSLNQ